jgi:hypothetical protein
MQILQLCVALSHFEDKRVVKEKESFPMILKAGMCLCYILPRCLPAFFIFSLLAVLGQFTLPLELFPCGEFCDVRAYCIVLQF